MQILNQEEARYNSADMNIAYRMSVDEYQQLCPYAEALEENWGKPPGRALWQPVLCSGAIQACLCVGGGLRPCTLQQLLLCLLMSSSMSLPDPWAMLGLPAQPHHLHAIALSAPAELQR